MMLRSTTGSVLLFLAFLVTLTGLAHSLDAGQVQGENVCSPIEANRIVCRDNGGWIEKRSRLQKTDSPARLPKKKQFTTSPTSSRSKAEASLDWSLTPEMRQIAHEFSNEDAKLEFLSNWMLAMGGTINGVQVGVTPLGRGLVATKDMPRGTVVISTPLSLCPSPKEFGKNKLMTEAEKMVRDAGYGDDYALAVLIEYETHAKALGKMGNFDPYVSWLPVPPLPSLLTDQELLTLDGMYCRDQIAKVNLAISKSYESIFRRSLFPSFPTTFDPKFNTIESWGRSLARVWSRSFNLYTNSSQNDLMWAMTPVADLINHDADAENNYIQDFDSDPHVFKMRLSKDVRKGEELLITYGAHTSLQYFLFYGFVLPENEHDYVNLRLLVPSFGEGMDMRPGKRANELVSLAEVHTTGEVPLDFLIEGAIVRHPDELLVSAVQKFSEWLQQEIIDRMASLPSTIEEDVQAKRELGPDASGSQMAMIQLKINHKRFLKSIIAYLDRILQKEILWDNDHLEKIHLDGAVAPRSSNSDFGLPLDEIDLYLHPPGGV